MTKFITKTKYSIFIVYFIGKVIFLWQPIALQVMLGIPRTLCLHLYLLIHNTHILWKDLLILKRERELWKSL